MSKLEKEGKVFMNGRSQAIRLPLEFRFEVDSVTISKVGDALIIRPKINGSDEWGPLKSVIGTFENQGDIERHQPETLNEREEL